MKTLLFLLISTFSFISVTAQEKKNNKIIKSVFNENNRFEFGLTHADFFTNTVMDNFRFNRNINKYHYYIGYSRILFQKHVIQISLSKFRSKIIPNTTVAGSTFGYDLNIFNAGYGYYIPFKRFELIPNLAVSYRYNSGERFFIGFRGSGQYPSGIFGRVEYETLGAVFSSDLNYFLLPNLAFGTKISLATYPFIKAHFKDDGIDKPSTELIENFRPLKAGVIYNFKLCLKI